MNFSESNNSPTGVFPYAMETTQMMEHSHGIAWTAHLKRDGQRVGVIEQAGRGGADVVLCDSPEARAQWHADIAAAFDGDEEAATFWLLEQEEALLHP